MLRLILPAAALAWLAGCFGTGCQSAAKLTPDQQQAVANVFATLNKAAADAGVTATAFVQIQSPEVFARQSFGIGGVQAFIVASANPPGQEQTGPMQIVRMPDGSQILVPATPAPPPPPTGACCVPEVDGGISCDNVSAQACANAGGIFKGYGTACAPGVCLNTP